MSLFSRHRRQTQIGLVLFIIAIAGCRGGSGAVDTVAAFRAQYCAIIDPCCAAAGLEKQCAAVVDAASSGASYDAWAAQACIDGLRTRQSSPAFCGSIGSPFETAPSWYGATLACRQVFTVRGTAMPGDACIAETDCATMPGAGATCSLQRCVPTRPGKLGDACIGTWSAELQFGIIVTTARPQDEVAFCDHASNLICDQFMYVCTAARALGERCDPLDCAADAYCAPDTGTCAARIPLGSICAGGIGACQDPGACAIGYCVSPPPQGADVLPLLCTP